MICINNPTIFQIPPRHFTNTENKKIFCKKFSKTGRLPRMQYKTSRKEALAAGDTIYIGAPCKRGHKGLRYTSASSCITCIRIYDEANKEKRKAYREANAEKIKAYREANKEKHKTYVKTWYKKNKEEVIARSIAWRKSNIEAGRINNKRYKDRYPEKRRAQRVKDKAGKINRTPKWLTKKDIKAMENIYAKSARKTLETGILHHVDHIIPLRGKLVSGLHVPSNLQVIPAKENLVKNNTYICE
jgi:hypothetical protein